MDLIEITPIFQVFPEPASNLLFYLVTVSPVLLGPALGEIGYCRLSRVPVARAILVQVSCLASQSPHRVTEYSGRLSRNDAPQLDPPVFDSLVGRPRDGRGTQIDRAGNPTAGTVLTQVWDLAVNLQGKRVDAVYVTLDDGEPVFREIMREFGLHPGIVHGNVSRQYQRIAVTLFPEVVNHRRHEPQDTTRTLEAP